MHIPNGSGYELMMELGGQFGIRGIALSGYGMENDLMQSQAAGFVTHLTKPISMQALDAALERVMALDSGAAPAGSRIAANAERPVNVNVMVPGAEGSR